MLSAVLCCYVAIFSNIHGNKATNSNIHVCLINTLSTVTAVNTDGMGSVAPKSKQQPKMIIQL